MNKGEKVEVMIAGKIREGIIEKVNSKTYIIRFPFSKFWNKKGKYEIITKTKKKRIREGDIVMDEFSNLMLERLSIIEKKLKWWQFIKKISLRTVIKTILLEV